MTAHVPPPARSDVERAAAAYDWPLVDLPDGEAIEGEAAWRAALDAAAAEDDPEVRLVLWQALQARPR